MRASPLRQYKALHMNVPYRMAFVNLLKIVPPQNKQESVIVIMEIYKTNLFVRGTEYHRMNNGL